MSKVNLSLIRGYFLFLARLSYTFIKYKIIILSFIFSNSLFGSNLYAQNQFKIDSLKKVISVESDKEKQVDGYNAIANLFSLEQTDSALSYAEKGLKLAEQIKYTKGQADSRYQLSYYYDRMGNEKQAIIHTEKAIELYITLGDSSSLTGCYNNLGVYYSYGTEQKKSLEYFIKALNLAESINETYALSEAYYNIGTFYEYVNEYGMALQYYQKALEIDISQNNTEDISWSYINLGNINMKLNRHDDAYENFVKAKKTINEVEDQYNSIELNIDFAYYFIEKMQPDSAKGYIDKVKEIYQEHKFERLKADIIAIEADYLLAKKQNALSIKLYDEAIEIYEQQKTTDGLWDIYVNKAKAFENMGELDKAYLALQKANKIKEETNPNEIAKVLGEFEQRETTKRQIKQYRIEQELLTQKQQTDLLRARSKFRYALLSIIFFVVLVVLTIFMYVIKRKNNKLLEENIQTINQQKLLLAEQYQKLETSSKELSELNSTKDKFFSILAHDLKNPFNVLIGLSEVILNDKEIKNSVQFDELMEGIYKTASTGYNLLENLLEWSRSQTGDIEHNPQPISIKEVVKTNIQFFHEVLKEKKIDVVISGLMDYTVYADANMVNFVLRNILNNAIKFSFPDGKIELSVQQKNDFYIVHIQDYGIGMDPDTVNNLFKIDRTVQRNGTAGETGTGLGLILCKEFVEKNKGEIWVESLKGKGSRFSFSLPILKS